MGKLLQSRITTSQLALPATALFTLLVWGLWSMADRQGWLQLGCIALAVYLMMTLNNLHALIRIYSRMVSCSFLGLTCSACFLFGDIRAGIMQCLFIASILVLFYAYQDKRATGAAYYSFLLLGLTSILYVHMLFFLPFLWLMMVTTLMCFSWRTFMASLLGVTTPYWFWCGWDLLNDRSIGAVTQHGRQLANLQPTDYDLLTTQHWLTLGFLGTLFVVAVIHLLSKGYLDKIRTRMFFAFLAWLDVVAALFLLLQPQHADVLLRVMIVATAPLVGHYLTLTATRLSNVLFIAMTGSTVILTIYHLWSTSSLF